MVINVSVTLLSAIAKVLLIKEQTGPENAKNER